MKKVRPPREGGVGGRGSSQAAVAIIAAIESLAAHVFGLEVYYVVALDNLPSVDSASGECLRGYMGFAGGSEGESQGKND